MGGPDVDIATSGSGGWVSQHGLGASRMCLAMGSQFWSGWVCSLIWAGGCRESAVWPVWSVLGALLWAGGRSDLGNRTLCSGHEVSLVG